MSTELQQSIDQAVESNATIQRLCKGQAKLEQGQAKLEQGQSRLEGRLTNVELELSRVGVLMESMNTDLKKILEVTTVMLSKGGKIDQHDDALTEQSGLIDVTRRSLKEHISNSRIHLSQE